MKNLLFFLMLSSVFVACKKKSTTNTSNPTNTISDSCGSNPKINFTCIGSPIGKFSSCIKDIEGNVYKTVTIGNQTWMAENLKVSKYSDGTTIPNITEIVQWQKNITGSWSYFNNDSVNNAKYGKLYNWYSVSKMSNGNKNICPTGWRVPSDLDWSELIDFIGDNAGAKMKEIGITSWKLKNSDATNSSLFTALPGVIQGGDGVGYHGVWWSLIETNKYNAKTLFLTYNFGITTVNEVESGKENFFSVRCIKDSL